MSPYTKYGVKVCVPLTENKRPASPQTYYVRQTDQRPILYSVDVNTLPGYFYGCGDLFRPYHLWVISGDEDYRSNGKKTRIGQSDG